VLAAFRDNNASAWADKVNAQTGDERHGQRDLDTSSFMGTLKLWLTDIPFGNGEGIWKGPPGIDDDEARRQRNMWIRDATHRSWGAQPTVVDAPPIPKDADGHDLYILTAAPPSKWDQFAQESKYVSMYGREAYVMCEVAKRLVGVRVTSKVERQLLSHAAGGVHNDSDGADDDPAHVDVHEESASRALERQLTRESVRRYSRPRGRRLVAASNPLRPVASLLGASHRAGATNQAAWHALVICLPPKCASSQPQTACCSQQRRERLHPQAARPRKRATGDRPQQDNRIQIAAEDWTSPDFPLLEGDNAEYDKYLKHIAYLKHIVPPIDVF
jgi:hypothetical protein